MSKLYIVMPVINCLEMTKEAIASIKTFEDFRTTLILIDNASTDGTQDWATERAGRDEWLKLIYIRNPERKGVAASWNQGIKIALEDPECKYIAILNNDIILHPKTLEHLMAFMDKTGYLMVTADNVRDRMSVETMLTLELPEKFTDYDCQLINEWRAEGPDFSCFMISPETIEVIGWFDEGFKGAYCEDQDYHARSMMARRHAEEHGDQAVIPGRIHFKRLTTAPYYHFASQTIAKNPELRPEISKMHAHNRERYQLKFGAEHPEVMDGRGYAQPWGDATKNWRDW